jgi:hypothetical protein
MRRTLVIAWLALVAFPAFAGATTAARTGLRMTLRICGASACVTVKTKDSRLYRRLFYPRSSSPLPPPVGAFYVLEFRFEGAPHAQSGWYVPSSHTTRWLEPHPTDWATLSRRGAAFLQHHLPAGPPHAAPRPVRVTVAQRRVHDTSPYVHVFDRFAPAPLPGPGARWISIRAVWPAGTPWRFERAELSALPAKRVLARPGGWFRIPIALAKTITRDAHA